MKLLKLAALFIAFGFISCEDDDATIIINGNGGGNPATSACVLSTNITADTTLDNTCIWQLDGRIVVESGATLTIEPGTIIKAFPGQQANSSVLIIARGGKIDAQGTASQPIIFTTTADNIELGQTAGTNLDQNDAGEWGGLIVLGNAPISVDGDATSKQIEGIPASDANGLFGGNDAADDSGTIRYVSIRHGGTLLGEGNEINGLTLGGVGNGTTIDHVEIVANLDDGIEFFGGSVNVSNLMVWAYGDDGIDIDEAYTGTITNAVVVVGDSSDHSLEIDGPAGSLQGAFVLQDVTLIGQDDRTDRGEIADFRDNAQGDINNVYVTGYTGIGTDTTGATLQVSDVELDADTVSANYTAGTLNFNNWVIDLPAGVATSAELFIDTSASGSSFEADAATFSSAATMQAAGVGADNSQLSWTYANNKAGLGF